MKKALCVLSLLVSTASFAGLSDGNTGTAFGGPGPISHSITVFVPITKDSNLCASCHLDFTKENPRSQKAIPKSHFKDDGTLDERRYVCTLCHAPHRTPEK